MIQVTGNMTTPLAEANLIVQELRVFPDILTGDSHIIDNHADCLSFHLAGPVSWICHTQFIREIKEITSFTSRRVNSVLLENLKKVLIGDASGWLSRVVVGRDHLDISTNLDTSKAMQSVLQCDLWQTLLILVLLARYLLST